MTPVQLPEVPVWVTLNPMTMCYETRDGTSVGAEIVDTSCCLADILHIARLRADQRALFTPSETNSDR